VADKPAPVIAPAAHRRTAVRFFEKPEVTLYRMGREVSKLTGEHGHLDLRTGSVTVYHGQATGEGVTVKAPRIALHLSVNQVVADGGAPTFSRGARGSVLMEEGGITMTSQRVVAPPSLVGHAPDGRVTLLAKDREAAAALMSTRLL